jgi:hypothetical protein
MNRYSDYIVPNVTNIIFIITRINTFKRLNDSHERKTTEGSIIHRKHNQGSASLELLVEEFHFFSGV